MKTLLLNYLLEASICLTVLYTFYYVLLRNERFFGGNRAFLLLALLLSLLIPAMEIPLSQQAIYVSQQPALTKYFAQVPFEENLSTPVSIRPGELKQDSFTNTDLLFYGYVSVALFMLGRLVFQVGQLYNMARKSGHTQKDYRLIASEKNLPTFSFFHWIFWNDTQSLTTAEKHFILQHELAHIRQKHSWDMLLLELIKVVFWFHPAVYLFQKALQEVHEYLADQAVIEQNDAYSYTQLLARQPLYRLFVDFTHSFNQSQLYKRIAMIQSAPTSAKPAVWKMAFALPILAALLFMYSCKTSEIAEPDPNSLVTTKGAFRLNEAVVVGYYKSSTEPKEVILDKVITGYGTTEEKRALTPSSKVDIEPVPVNGISSFEHYIRKNIQHPAQIAKAGQGSMWVEFTVNPDGSLSDISVLKSLNAYYDQQVITLVKNAPAWNPGKQNGQPIAVRKVVPIHLGNSSAETSFTQIKLISEKPVDSQPAPIEGLDTFYKKIGKTIMYPLAAREEFIEGQVWVQFTVNTDGSLANIGIAEPLHPVLDQEAVRVVSEAGISWKPAVVNGQAQASTIFFPVSFKIGV